MNQPGYGRYYANDDIHPVDSYRESERLFL